MRKGEGVPQLRGGGRGGGEGDLKENQVKHPIPPDRTGQTVRMAAGPAAHAAGRAGPDDHAFAFPSTAATAAAAAAAAAGRPGPRIRAQPDHRAAAPGPPRAAKFWVKI